MCGIVGFLRLDPAHAGPLKSDVAARMLRAIRRRGPDGEGQWESMDRQCWLGHRRLAIIDLAAGSQPMSNEDGSVWTVFNGEIYNYKSMRAELLRCGHTFHSASDTEVLVHGYEQWGGNGLVKRLQGIFAFAIYDQRRRELFLARDHLGVKPLYWWTDGKVLLFGSEIKSLLPYPDLKARQVNPEGVAQFLVCRYVSRPDTMFLGIHKLPEGSWMTANPGSVFRPQPRQYWDVRYEPSRDISLEEATDELDALLGRTVEMQLMSDVPIGAQLSGGVDSSVIVALMDQLRRESGITDPIKTFSVGFDVERFSELHYAKMIAQRYNTEHHEMRIGFDDFVSELPLLSWIYDEPIGEPPAVPTYYMCKKAKETVTVMLCGEGADEQFGGYSKYAFDQYSRYVDWLPTGLRRGLLRSAGASLPFQARRARSILEILALRDPASRYASWYGAFDTAIQTELLTGQVRDIARDKFLTHMTEDVIDRCDSGDHLHRFMYCDIHTRLVDDLLVKGDRMSMGASIEARVPFLDHKVVEFAASLPAHFKVQGLRTKILLKRLAERYAPHDLIYRRKVGFTVPLSDWFAGPLKKLIQDVLLSERCLSRGYWRPEIMQRIVTEHVERRVDREQGIWVLLALELWHRLYVDDDGSEAAVDRVREDILPSISPKSDDRWRRIA